MHKQTIQFAVMRDKDNIIRIGRSSIFQPKINSKTGSIKWYEEKPKQDSK